MISDAVPQIVAISTARHVPQQWQWQSCAFVCVRVLSRATNIHIQASTQSTTNGIGGRLLHCVLREGLSRQVNRLYVSTLRASVRGGQGGTAVRPQSWPGSHKSLHSASACVNSEARRTVLKDSQVGVSPPQDTGMLKSSDVSASPSC